MSKSRSKRRQETNPTQPQLQKPVTLNDEDDFHSIKIKKLNVTFRTKAQEDLWNMIESKEISIISGPAGTGKSHITMLKALDLVQKFPEKYKKIIITKPNIESGPEMGFLPGTVDEKLAPYIYSAKYIFSKILGQQKCERMFERKQVEVMAIGYMRGINIDNAIFILDEAQNCSRNEIRTILSRIGENCKMILNGDETQIDTKLKIEQTGLYIAMQRLKDIPQIGIFRFNDTDIVRNPLISVILKQLNGDFK